MSNVAAIFELNCSAGVVGVRKVRLCTKSERHEIKSAMVSGEKEQSDRKCDGWKEKGDEGRLRRFWSDKGGRYTERVKINGVLLSAVLPHL